MFMSTDTEYTLVQQLIHEHACFPFFGITLLYPGLSNK